MKAIIMAGGQGTRIASVAADIPKPMISICGKPILEYQIEVLRRYGVLDILLIIGHLGNVIKDYFGDGSKFDVRISYFEETIPLGTAGALFKIYDLLDETFLLINGDIIFDIDVPKLIEFHRSRKSLATLVSHPNNHPYDSALIVTDMDGRIIHWMNKEENRMFYQNRVNAGIHVLTKLLLQSIFDELRNDKIDLDRDILKPMVKTNRMFAYDTPEYIKDMGTPERYYQVSTDIMNGLVSKKNLGNLQHAIFIDRDGTINKFDGFISKQEQFELLPGVPEAIKIINTNGYLAIVVTNQPVIARGDCSVLDLQNIHNKMETLLGQQGAYLDSVFYCPHHPDKGFAGERVEYKINCSCRKPKPGMILAAAEKYNIDLHNSYMIGDDDKDIVAGESAGCKTLLLSTDVSQVGTYRSLLDAVKSIFGIN